MNSSKNLIEMRTAENFTYYNVVETEFEFDYGKKFNPTIVQPHFHNAYELLLFMQGNAVYSVEGETYELSGGDLLLTNPRELHRPVFTTEAVYERAIVFVKPAFLSEFVSEEYSPFWGLEQRRVGTQNKIESKLVKEHGIDTMFNHIKYYCNKDLPESKAMVKSYVIQLLNAVNSVIKLDDKKREKNNKILDIISYINKNIFDRITLNMLEDAFFMSKYHISHIFKEQTGLTVVEYITRKRVLYARELMMSGLSAGEAAQKAGFTDYSMFYKAFKKITGASPSEYTVK